MPIYTTFDNFLSYTFSLCSFSIATWSYISSKVKLRLRSIIPVAQNLQVRLQPICDETQAVFLLSVGINTPSIKCPSKVLNLDFNVPSLLCWVASTVMACMSKSVAIFLRRSSDSLFISSKFRAFFFHNHS